VNPFGKRLLLKGTIEAGRGWRVPARGMKRTKIGFIGQYWALKIKILGASPEAFKYAGGFERLDERSKLRGIAPASE
jgi:hypothetical protein